MPERTGTSILSFTNCAPQCSLKITDKWPANAKATAVYISSIQNKGIDVWLIELTCGLLHWTMFRASDGYIADMKHQQFLTPIDADEPWALQITPIGQFAPGTSISVNVALVWSLHVLPPQPAPPYGLSASQAITASGFKIQVYWMVSSAEDSSYTLERARNGGFSPIAEVKALKPSTQADVAALTPSTRGNNQVDSVSSTHQGEQIQYRVKAHNQFGESGYSDILTVGIDAAALPVPAAPYGLSAAKKWIGNNRTEVHVYWMVSSTSDQSYALERSRGGAAFVKVADVAALTPSTKGNNRVDTVSNTYQGEQIQYRVKAHNQFGDGQYSEALTVTF